jgi:uncharacterized protein
MMFADLPAAAAWRHGDTRTGLEATAFEPGRDGWIAAGSTTALEAGAPWWVSYRIELSSSFVTRRAAIAAAAGTGAVSSVLIESDGGGRWTVNGHPAPGLDGCLDVDLESSAMTNALPMRRLSLAPGAAAAAPAVYVRVPGLAVDRLEQHYARLADGARGPAFAYEAPAFGFACRIDYDWSGLVVSYPGIAERIG